MKSLEIERQHRRLKNLSEDTHGAIGEAIKKGWKVVHDSPHAGKIELLNGGWTIGRVMGDVPRKYNDQLPQGSFRMSNRDIEVTRLQRRASGILIAPDTDRPIALSTTQKGLEVDYTVDHQEQKGYAANLTIFEDGFTISPEVFLDRVGSEKNRMYISSDDVTAAYAESHYKALVVANLMTDAVSQSHEVDLSTNSLKDYQNRWAAILSPELMTPGVEVLLPRKK